MKIKKQYWICFAIASLILGGVILYSLKIKSDARKTQRPHIVIIMADDMGRNDVGFHGSNQIPTPNIDGLAYCGVILDRFYTQYACTPSRVALLTGNYPMRYGMHGLPIRAGQNRSLAEDAKLLPQLLKNLGYSTHLVGKWHLGAERRRSTPTMRGFDTHFGYWHGFVGYFDFTAIYELTDDAFVRGFDLHDGLRPAWDDRGKYATELFTEKSLEIIDRHQKDVPLFLMLSHLAPHTGHNGTELGVPDVTLTHERYSYIQDPRRRLYADVVNRLDDSVGQIIRKLSEKQMLENSIILFFSDNGAQTVGSYENAGSNWPLRGLKLSDFEGGIRAAAAIFSPLLTKQGYVNTNLMHVTDLLPTFYAAAGGNLEDLGRIDGVNQWDTLSLNLTTNRSEILVNINEVDNTSAIITEKGRYKFLKGTFKDGLYDNYYGESGHDPSVLPYDPSEIIHRDTNMMLQSVVGVNVTVEQVFQLRNRTDLSWCRSPDDTPFLSCIEGCLFDLDNDPCETTNLIQTRSDLVGKMHERLAHFERELVPQPKEIFDPASNPDYYNGTWCTWLDDQLCYKTPNRTQLEL